MVDIGDKEKQVLLDRQFQNLKVTPIFLLPFITFLAFRAQDIILLFFGKEMKTVLPLQIIIWSALPVYYNYLFLRIALFFKRSGIVFSSLAILALYTVVLNFCLIPRYGLEGIGIATIASVTVMFIFIVFCLTKGGIRMPLYKSFEKPAVATMALTLILHYVDSLSFSLALLSGVVGYSLIFIITSALDK